MGRRSEPAVEARRRAWADQRVFDLLFALVMTVLALFDAVADEVLDGERAPDALAFGLIMVGGVSLVWRRRAPIGVAVVVGVVMITFWFRDHGAFLAVLGLPALYAIAAYEPDRRRAWTAIGVTVVAMMVGASATVLNPPDGYLFPNAITMAAYLAATAAIGVGVRNRQRIFVDTQKRIARAEADRRVEADRAVARERTRIAREMHDVVAHGMSVIAVQAAAAQDIAHQRPDKVVEILGRIEDVSRSSLAEMRRMLGALRSGEGGETASLLPQPGISDIADVVADTTASGVATRVSVTGEQRDLAAGLELAAFRIVQESLTNVRKHAGPGAVASVAIRFEPRWLRLDISDDGRPQPSPEPGYGSGNGLVGMRERVDIYGGTLSVGPSPGGGWAVRAALPISDADEQQSATGQRVRDGSRR